MPPCCPGWRKADPNMAVPVNIPPGGPVAFTVSQTHIICCVTVMCIILIKQLHSTRTLVYNQHSISYPSQDATELVDANTNS